MATSMMKAAQLVGIGQPLELRDVPIPEPGDEDVLLQVARCGLNGGDPHLVSGDFRVSPEYVPNLRLPITIGHDPVGTVVRVGQHVQGFSPGDRVFINPNMECGQCIYCHTNRLHLCQRKLLRGWIPVSSKSTDRFDRYRDGFCAEYAVAHAVTLFKLPDSVSFKTACHLNEMGVAYRALKRTPVVHSDVLAISGASGCTGGSAVLLARLFNPRKIIAIARNRHRLERLRSLDPDRIEVLSTVEDDLSARLLDLTDGEGVDAYLDFVPSGVSTTQQVLYRMRPGGRVVLAGGCTEDLSISYRFLMRSSLEITASRGPFPEDVPVLLDFLVNGELDLSPMAVHEFPLDSINDALRVFKERPTEDPFWVHVLPNGEAP